jgi:hypothetical protein
VASALAAFGARRGRERERRVLGEEERKKARVYMVRGDDGRREGAGKLWSGAGSSRPTGRAIRAGQAKAGMMGVVRLVYSPWATVECSGWFA